MDCGLSLCLGPYCEGTGTFKFDFFDKIFERSVKYVHNYYFNSNYVYMDCSVPRAFKVFGRAEWTKNNNFNICRFFINTSSDHFTLSKHPIIKIIVYKIAFVLRCYNRVLMLRTGQL